MADLPFVSKVGKKVYHSQAREIVTKVHEFMKRESLAGQPIIGLKKVTDRVTEATGVPGRTVRQFLSEKKKAVEEGSSFKTPNKKRLRRCPKTDLDNFDLGVIRRTTNEHHLITGQLPTVKSLLTLLRESINFQGSEWTLRKVLKKLNFRWKKTINNRKVLIEKIEIRDKRVEYLKKLKAYRDENRPVIYMDETYVHTTHTRPNSWSDGTNAGLKVPVSKGNRLIIVHAGNENGFVKDALLTFESGKKTGDYHNDMNFDNYEKWITNKLIPNIPPSSVIVIDNAPYHNVELNKAPNSNSRKNEMLEWLAEKGIAFLPTMLKPELYSLVLQHKSKYKMFKIDALLAEHGHSVLRLPPYHPDLNPIEMIWCCLKQKVGKRNVSFSMTAIQQMVKEVCENITRDNWLSRVNHVKKNEQIYRDMEPLIDEATENFVINLEDDSDSERQSDSDSESEEDGDGNISGVDLLD